VCRSLSKLRRGVSAHGGGMIGASGHCYEKTEKTCQGL